MPFFSSSEADEKDTASAYIAQPAPIPSADLLNPLPMHACVFRPGAWAEADLYQVALARKPEGTNPEHAFIVVQGMTESEACFFRRYDLFIDENNKPKAKVVPKDYQPDEDTEAGRNDCFYTAILRQETVCVMAWDISRQQAARLHAAMLAAQKAPPIYGLSGDKALLNVLTSKSLKPSKVHNCFTFAREQLAQVLPHTYTALTPKYDDFVAARTSRYLRVPTVKKVHASTDTSSSVSHPKKAPPANGATKKVSKGDDDTACCIL